MTTPESRSRILSKLSKVWERNPEMRLCQLIENALNRCEGHGESCCIFHVEDGTLERTLDNPFWETL